MRKSVLVLVGLAVAVVVIGFVLSHRSNSNPNPSPGEQAIASNTGSQYASAGKSNFTSNPPRHRPTNDSNPGVPTPPPPPTVTNANVITNWEEKLDTILTSDKPDPDKAKDMIQMFPLLPTPEAQEEIAHHISESHPR